MDPAAGRSGNREGTEMSKTQYFAAGDTEGQRHGIILAALAPANGRAHTPVQVQKLLFLIDREVSPSIGGPFFDFRPYHYGPFDKTVYKELESLAETGLVDVHGATSMQSFALTPTGQTAGLSILETFPPQVKDFVIRTSEFVRSISFSALVSAIYKAYPEMRANSVFQE